MRYQAVRGSPQEVADELTQLHEGDLLMVTADGQPIWSAPSYGPGGEMVVRVAVRAHRRPNPLDAPAARFVGP